MKDTDKKPQKPEQNNKNPKEPSEREARLAQALRENLMRRKGSKKPSDE